LLDVDDNDRHEEEEKEEEEEVVGFLLPWKVWAYLIVFLTV
jgi:hypothetical protein